LDDFRDNLPADSIIEELFEFIETGDVVALTGTVDERGEGGHWDTFRLESFDVDGDERSFNFKDSDIPDGYDWDDFFEYLEHFIEDYEIDYKNPYSGD
jgi:hypothetical protein